MKTVYWLGITFFRAATTALFGYRVIGKEKLVQEGGVLIAANHESFLDPPLIGIAYDSEVNYLARKTLFKGFFKWLYTNWNAVPIDQDRPDMSSLKRIIKILRSGERVVIFPEGARTLDGELQPAQAGTGLIASKSKAIVQPIRIFGARDCLPRGSSRVKMARITLVVGDPIEFTPEEIAAKGRDGYQIIADRIMAEIAQLELPR
ncbi:1-acyl-sn-glycerol-3-phosphate acyltransferase [Akkermansiaceae bacterium]|nr:1-acyl-sn-glycerol-3-phosphate acyltransferase [Akkermansiaceae bacterium]MDB4436281.1 1-acyl-sn-glycerol-3-phosphate acyltransferase [Akkermansiaceae bacterium]